MSDFQEIRDCDLCEKPFVADEAWKRKCLLCWKEENNYELGKGDRAFELMRDAFLDAKTDVVNALRRAERAEAEAAKARNAFRKVRAALDRERAKPKRGSGELTPERVKQLIRLCHPDRHGGNETSHEVTKWLLELRGK